MDVRRRMDMHRGAARLARSSAVPEQRPECLRLGSRHDELVVVDEGQHLLWDLPHADVGRGDRARHPGDGRLGGRGRSGLVETLSVTSWARPKLIGEPPAGVPISTPEPNTNMRDSVWGMMAARAAERAQSLTWAGTWAGLTQTASVASPGVCIGQETARKRLRSGRTDAATAANRRSFDGPAFQNALKALGLVVWNCRHAIEEAID